MENNIFQFATSELSQDAVICWCLNWLNYKQSDLYPLAKDMLSLVCPKITIPEDERIEVIQQWFKTDILLYLRSSETAVIIEDKVYSFEHSDQIAAYKAKISNLSDKEKKEKNIANISSDKLYTTYFKTGFFYDCDKEVKSDFVVTGKDFLKVIEKYKDKNLILSYYAEHLNNLVNWYDIYGVINSENVQHHHIAQYNLMRHIFEEKLWCAPSKLYKVYHGSNRDGSPWTEMVIYTGELSDNRSYSVFWRIDTDTQGPYMSLRFYDGLMNKENDEHKALHSEKYKYFREICQRICSENEWQEIKYMNTENYKESTLARIDLSDVLLNWHEKNQAFKERIINYNTMFLKECL